MLTQSLSGDAYKYEEVTSETDVRFRLIHYQSKLLGIQYLSPLNFTNALVRWPSSLNQLVPIQIPILITSTQAGVGRHY